MFDVIYVYISTGIKTQRDVLQELRFNSSYCVGCRNIFYIKIIHAKLSNQNF